MEASFNLKTHIVFLFLKFYPYVKCWRVNIIYTYIDSPKNQEWKRSFLLLQKQNKNWFHLQGS